VPDRPPGQIDPTFWKTGQDDAFESLHVRSFRRTSTAASKDAILHSATASVLQLCDIRAGHGLIETVALALTRMPAGTLAARPRAPHKIGGTP